MTTNVIDFSSMQVCSDARWSLPAFEWMGREVFVYVDNIDFHKLAHNESHVIVFAGDAELIGQWKTWWAGGGVGVRPDVQVGPRKIVLSIVDKNKNELVFDQGNKLIYACMDTGVPKVILSGSGKAHAFQHWNLAHCAIRAIEEAAESDRQTGGEVKYVDYNYGKDNISEEECDYSSLVSSFMEKGVAMTTTTDKTATPQLLPLAQHPAANDIANKLASGDVYAQACIDESEGAAWTAEAKAKLDAVLDSIFPNNK